MPAAVISPSRGVHIATTGAVTFHSDRGSEYMGAAFCTCVARHGLLQSANGLEPRDNAHAESSFHSLKAELTRGVTVLAAQALRTALDQYIRDHNTRRIHSEVVG